MRAATTILRSRKIYKKGEDFLHFISILIILINNHQSLLSNIFPALPKASSFFPKKPKPTIKMKTSFVLTLATILSAAIAMPTATNGGGGGGGGSTPAPYDCPSGLYSVAQCCATDVLGVADLDCKTRKSPPNSSAAV
jgi:hypothetical protein